jgi:EAL domain-containing protein (putative c-di-GMP-specific phosphodiesterase class I)
MVTEASHETMVRNVIGLAHGLSIAVVAEGVETEEHMTLLAKLGCEVAQGYHIAKPMDEPSLMKWLENRKMGKLGSDIQ